MIFRRLKIRKLSITAVTVLLLCAIQPATAQLAVEVEAHELAPSNIILPGTVNGMVTFRTCDGDCEEEYSRARLTANTRFFVGGTAVRFDDFRKDFANVKHNKDGYALLSVDVKTKTITSIRIQG